MRAVRLRGTQPERILRAALRRLGLRYRSNPTNLPGRPDAVVASCKLAIFAHGCFWHRHQGCPRTTTPKRNANFWLAKFLANQERDQRKTRELKQLGYRSIVMWECELLEVESAARILKRRLPRKPLALVPPTHSRQAQRVPTG